MTSCRSFSVDGLHAGETVAVSLAPTRKKTETNNPSAGGLTFQSSLRLQASGQQMECVAHNGVGGSGVHAVARCCVIGGLRCRVHVSPEAGRDAECVEPQHHLTGESQPVLMCVAW